MESIPLISQKAKLVLSAALTKSVPKGKSFEKLGDIFAPGKFKQEGNAVNVLVKIDSIEASGKYAIIAISDSTGRGLLCIMNGIASKLEIGQTYSFFYLRCTIVNNIPMLKTLSDTIIVKNNK